MMCFFNREFYSYFLKLFHGFFLFLSDTVLFSFGVAKVRREGEEECYRNVIFTLTQGYRPVCLYPFLFIMNPS